MATARSQMAEPRLFAPRAAPAMPPGLQTTRELWRHGLGVRSAPEEALRDLRRAAAAARAATPPPAPPAAAPQRALRRTVSLALPLVPRPAPAPAPPARPAAFAADPLDVGFSSESAREWRRLWEARVLARLGPPCPAPAPAPAPAPLPLPPTRPPTALASAPRTAPALTPLHPRLAVAPGLGGGAHRTRGRQRRWHAAPAERAAAAVAAPHDAARPSEAPVVWSEVTVWTDALVARVLRAQESESAFVRRGASTLTRGTLDWGRSVPAAVVAGLRRCVADPVFEVALAAAVSLCSLAQEDAGASAVLERALATGTAEMRLAAARCLASAGVASQPLVRELLAAARDPGEDGAAAAALLSSLSERSTLVRALCAEALRSDAWQERFVAASLLRHLHGALSSDVCDTVADLCWHDEHEEVRRSAIKTLCARGHAALIYDGVAEKLCGADPDACMRALAVLGLFGRATARLQEGVVRCLRSEFSAVRRAAAECCEDLAAAGGLCAALQAKLTEACRWDPCGAVRAAAIRACVAHGAAGPDLDDALAWAVCSDRDEASVAAACGAVAALRRPRSAAVATALSQRCSDGASPRRVAAAARDALAALGVDPAAPPPAAQEALEAVRGALGRLCGKDALLAAALARSK